MNSAASATPTAKDGSGSGTYLTFQVGSEEYGVEILKVREIIGMLPMTPVPGSPSAVLGVINLRGKVIPVLSMRQRFGLPPIAANPLNVIIIVEADGQPTGLAVDLVREVASFDDAHTEPPPTYGLEVNAGFVKALGKSQGRILILLDIARVLALANIPAEIAKGSTP
ncbi:MAG: purine-binding chemotaxis protein CheW [Planctomycetes bacterium]|nr:purine-binding chemotaxis protein CheW [Planctomycetota bacterium]